MTEMIREWWKDEHPLTFTWDLWYACNYRCSYCWWEMENLWADLAKRHRILSPEAWAEIWGRVHARHGEARIDVLGGEPLLYPRATELLAALSRQHRLVVTTNLSPELEALEKMASALSPERVHFNVSFHPQYTTLAAVLDKIGRLRARGYLPGVLFVTWPPFLDRLSEYRGACREAGIPFSPMVFQGEHAGRRYPDAYTPEERALIEDTMGGRPEQNEAERDYRLDVRATLGKPCHAGRVYANIKADGQVFRCGQDAFGLKPMGNLFDEDFRLHDAPKPCPYERCSCLEFKYLDELMRPPRA
jgi:MoaA/NifB/PqqE/SkfB family radical SAM enzyme